MWPTMNYMPEKTDTSAADPKQIFQFTTRVKIVQEFNLKGKKNGFLTKEFVPHS